MLRGGKALPLYSRVTGAAGTPPAIVIPAAKAQQPQLQLRQGDSLWEQFLGAAGGGTASFAGLRELPHIVEAAAYSNILFSSGTTVSVCWRALHGGSSCNSSHSCGRGKAVRDLVCNLEWFMVHVTVLSL